MKINQSCTQSVEAPMATPTNKRGSDLGNRMCGNLSEKHGEKHGKRLGAVLAAVAASAALSLTTAPAAQAAPEMKCTGRDYRCDHSDYAAHSGTSYWLMATGHNCTNYVAWRLIREGVDPKIDYLHNGGDWADDARGHQIPVDHAPVPGAVAQWTSGAGGVSWAGHVAYVEAVGDGWIEIAEDNYSSGPMSIRVIHTTDREWPSNFIHFPRPTPPPAPDQAANPSVLNHEALLRALLPRVWENA